jgi:beta-lactamase regulating signal transducer with metallopeptidase domain
MNGLVTFFRGILEVSLFASAMIAVVLLIRKITKDRISIKVVSFLWLLVIVRLCLPGMLESPVHVDTLFPAPAQARQTDELPLSQSDATNFYENSAVNHTLTDSKAATLRQVPIGIKPPPPSRRRSPFMSRYRRLSNPLIYGCSPPLSG